jgi:hypothetical protein
MGGVADPAFFIFSAKGKRWARPSRVMFESCEMPLADEGLVQDRKVCAGRQNFREGDDESIIQS